MLKNTLDTAESLDHICPVVVQVPQLTVMLLMRPPERVLLENLILLEVLPDSPSLVVSQSKAILLEKGIDSRDSSVPRVIKVFESQPSILGLSFLSFQCVFRPHSL